MTSKEFILWLKGFSEGAHEYNITPKQWDIVKEKLAEVKDEEPIGFPFGIPNRIAPSFVILEYTRSANIVGCISRSCLPNVLSTYSYVSSKVKCSSPSFVLGDE